jgi:hypothetical protein
MLVDNESALERGGWIGFSPKMPVRLGPMPKPVAVGANTRPRRRIFCQRVEDNAFHLG